MTVRVGRSKLMRDFSFPSSLWYNKLQLRKKMKQKRIKTKHGLAILFLVVLVVTLAVLLRGSTVAVLSPKGFVAFQERKVLITLTALMMLVAIPMLASAFYIAHKYSAKNKEEKEYAPEAAENTKLQFLWWAIPGTLIMILSIINWRVTHQLDPYKAIASTNKPITIQVIALRWKWLFIYPEQNIATINFIEIPQNTPITFQLTADAPMNSFWIPQLSGQMYAMAGMSTQLHLIANQLGEFKGSAAEINGKGFAGMDFTVRSATQTDFNYWLDSIQHSSSALTTDEYHKLAEPSTNNEPAYYSLADKNLYNKVINYYMGPPSLYHKH